MSDYKVKKGLNFGESLLDSYFCNRPPEKVEILFDMVKKNYQRSNYQLWK